MAHQRDAVTDAPGFPSAPNMYAHTAYTSKIVLTHCNLVAVSSKRLVILHFRCRKPTSHPHPRTSSASFLMALAATMGEAYSTANLGGRVLNAGALPLPLPSAPSPLPRVRFLPAGVEAWACS